MDTQVSMKDLMARASLVMPKIGELVTGEVINVSKNAVLIDLGSLGTGIVYPGEFYDNTTLQRALKPGQTVSAVLLDVEDEDGQGYRDLSLRQAQQTSAWEDISEKKQSGEVITTTIVNINKGGLIVEVNGVQGFLPLSQLSAEHYPKVEGGDTTKIVQILQKYRGQEFEVKILDFSEKDNKLIVSEKAINEDSVKEQLAHFSVGDVVEGKITDVTDFGAFMAVTPPKTENEETPSTPIEGLIHISEIDYKMIDNPRNVLSTGQEVEAKIISIEHGKISLSLKALKQDPWDSVAETYKPGQTITGTIAKTTTYGALVSLNDSITGLIPISEFGGKRPSEVVAVGDTKDVTVVSIDAKDHKMLLKLDGMEPAKKEKEVKEEKQDEKSE